MLFRSLVRIDVNHAPFGLTRDQLRVVAVLGSKGIELILDVYKRQLDALLFQFLFDHPQTGSGEIALIEPSDDFGLFRNFLVDTSLRLIKLPALLLERMITLQSRFALWR